MPFARSPLAHIACALVAVGALALLPACGGRQGNDTPTYSEAAQEAYEQAERAFQRKDYEGARMRFQRVSQEFPYSQYAALAEFRIADTYFVEKSYLRAIEAFRRFTRSRPSHERVPEAQFRIAEAYFEQMPGSNFLLPPPHERDLSETENAYRAMRLFLEAYPDTPFAGDAERMLVEARERLANHELYVAEFYIARDNPQGAAQRAEFLVTTYPDALSVPDALFIYGRAMIELGDTAEAVQTLRRLVSDFPETERASDASTWLAQHGFANRAENEAP